jgi:hypothetical protein
MQTLQTALDYLALLPVATAALLFIGYCWERSTPTPTPSGNVDEPESIMDIIDPYGILEDLPNAGPEDCDIEPTRADETLSLIERKFAEADKDRISNEPLTQMRETPTDEDSTDWEPRWAALQLEPEARTTVKEPAIAVTNPNSLTSHQLRRECQKLGIKWRNAHGKGKHLTRDEMLERIGQAIA